MEHNFSLRMYGVYQKTMQATCKKQRKDFALQSKK